MPPSPAPLDAAWSFLWGKRRWRRLTVDLDVEVLGASGRLRARAVNLSAGGTLIRIPRHEISRVLAGAIRPGLAEIQALFVPAFRVRFTAGQLTLESELIRISWRPDEPAAVYLGCRFKAALLPEQIRALGLSPRTCAAESGFLAIPSEEMPFTAEAGAVLEILEDGADRPVYAGLLLAMNRSALAARLPPADATQVVAHLSGKAFTLRIVVDDRVLWRESGWLLAVRLLDAADGLELVVQGDSEPHGAARKLFRPRGRALLAS